MSELSELFDVFFNGSSFDGRPAQKAPRTLSATDLIKRGTSHVRLGDRIYRVEVKDVTDKVTKIA